MTTPEPDEQAREQERRDALERMTMDYPVTITRLPAAARRRVEQAEADAADGDADD